MTETINLIWSAILLGISSGIYCLSICFPFLAPFMVAEKRLFKKSLKIFLSFISGRLIGYLMFGAIIGFLSFEFNTTFLNIMANLSLLLMSLLLILYALGVLKIKGKHFCPVRVPSKPVPFLFGLFSGFNICPPFLFAINLVLTTHSIVNGIIFFGAFFIGTTIYLIPLLFFTPLGYIQKVRRLARLAALIVGTTYFAYEIFYFYRALFIYKIYL